MNMLLWSTDVTGPEHDATFELLREIGYDGVEIPIFDSEVEKYGRLGRRLEELGLAALGVGARSEDDSPISADAGGAGARAGGDQGGRRCLRRTRRPHPLRAARGTARLLQRRRADRARSASGRSRACGPPPSTQRHVT